MSRHMSFSFSQDEHLCCVFLSLGGRGQQLPGVFRGYPLITPKSGAGKSKKPGKAAAKYGGTGAGGGALGQGGALGVGSQRLAGGTGVAPGLGGGTGTGAGPGFGGGVGPGAGPGLGAGVGTGKKAAFTLFCLSTLLFQKWSESDLKDQISM
ncbi:glycine-rich cell wall structural protein-like [Cheilinus undulatus]|uniref:glycine-rich cell wall structural protein-like n=1 Tax=Cheilinus undulatus TaxID=241271 RepID=UPI001BD3BC2C|nr:glycine-rich cell wall structural protein-like [Cheilinus undulatus]